MFPLILSILAASPVLAAQVPGLPSCRAELNDSMNQAVATREWAADFFTDSIGGATHPVLITTSLGDNQVMSLWAREKKSGGQAGMFSFVDLSSGRDQYLRFFMADGFSIGVTCRWQPGAPARR